MRGFSFAFLRKNLPIMPLPLKALAGACLLAVLGSASAQQQVVNLYSARHYSTDEALYDNFTKACRDCHQPRVDADDAGILAPGRGGAQMPLT